MHIKISKKRFCAAATCAALIVSAGNAQAHRKFHLLYTFTGSNGAYAVATPIVDLSGNVYGATQRGGPLNKGEVFKLAPDGSETILEDFGNSNDGESPVSSVWRGAGGNLFSTTFWGPSGTKGGTVFEITAAGTTVVLHTFSSTDTAGYGPQSGVIGDAQGNLYGTTSGGGLNGQGTIYKLAPDGTTTVFYSFGATRRDAGSPSGQLAIDADGNLYGTSRSGGTYGGGTVFKVAPDGTERVVYSFGSEQAISGFWPSGGVLLDASGNMYATTKMGGLNSAGTLYKIAPDGHAKKLHDFYAFDILEGAQPNGGLVRDAKGNIYGTTYQGGNLDHCGTVFEFSPGGRFRVLHTFDETPHRIKGGIQPLAGLAIDADGNLYGMTAFAGGTEGNMAMGTVFKIDAE